MDVLNEQVNMLTENFLESDQQMKKFQAQLNEMSEKLELRRKQLSDLSSLVVIEKQPLVLELQSELHQQEEFVRLMKSRLHEHEALVQDILHTCNQITRDAERERVYHGMTYKQFLELPQKNEHLGELNKRLQKVIESFSASINQQQTLANQQLSMIEQLQSQAVDSGDSD